MRFIANRRTYDKTGTCVEAWAGKATSDLTKSFCRLFGLHMSPQNGWQIVGQEASLTLAAEWCARMQFFFNIWVSAGAAEDFAFAGDEDASHVATSEFKTLVDKAPDGDPVSTRCKELQGLTPRCKRK